MSGLIPERLEQITRISGGSHSEGSGYCVMEAVAYVAGEEWSDHPQCACPVIANFLRLWNDALPDDGTRTRLLVPLIPRIIGSSSTEEVELRRSYLALDWLGRVVVPAWLDLARLSESADRLRGLPEISDRESVAALNDALCVASAAALDAVLDAADAAANAARDAACNAAWDAACNAARGAACNAARAAALDTVLDAAWSAACYAARAVALDAGRDAARAAALQHTVEALQQSALELIDRMLLTT